MRLAMLAALIVIAGCLHLGGAFDQSWDQAELAARCTQPALPAEMLERIYSCSVAAAAEEADAAKEAPVQRDDLEVSYARYCEPFDSPLPPDPSPAAP